MSESAVEPASRVAVLFLCTGNYYRSRTAEALFNHYAQQAGLQLEASSRGLKLDARNQGPISPYAVTYLKGRGVPYADRWPADCTEADLAAAGQVVAVDASEHRVLMEARFPEWAPRIEYWLVHDIDRTNPRDALTTIDEKVKAIVEAFHAPL